MPAARIGQFDARRPFGPWFLRSVVNDAIKAASRGRRQVSLDEAYESEEARALGAWLADPAPGPEELAQQAELSETIRSALQRLSPAERAVVILRYYLAASEREMAEALGCPPGTVKSRLSAARGRLRRWLEHFRPARPGMRRRDAESAEVAGAVGEPPQGGGLLSPRE